MLHDLRPEGEGLEFDFFCVPRAAPWQYRGAECSLATVSGSEQADQRNRFWQQAVSARAESPVHRLNHPLAYLKAGATIFKITTQLKPIGWLPEVGLCKIFHTLFFPGRVEVTGQRFLLEREQWVSRSLAEVFPFFADAGNLEKLTPGFLKFRILTPVPIPMTAGTLIDYRIRIAGIPQSWKTLIEVFDPPNRFVDVQLKGPYAFWRHTHEFEESGGGTRIRDRVEYEMPFGLLGSLARILLVRRMLERIFDFRSAMIAERFGADTHEGLSSSSPIIP